jgi:Arc/MetJ family transcription regulator
MRATLSLDDELLAKAAFYTGILEKSALLREALGALVEREAARRLARLGGTEPDLAAIPRRRTNICRPTMGGSERCSMAARFSDIRL